MYEVAIGWRWKYHNNIPLLDCNYAQFLSFCRLVFALFSLFTSNCAHSIDIGTVFKRVCLRRYVSSSYVIVTLIKYDNYTMLTIPIVP